MSDASIFMEKAQMPTDKDVAEKLPDSYELWEKVRNIVLSKYPGGVSEWNFPGKKYGWSFRIKDKKRAIIYLLPRDKFFKVGFVFGDKAVADILESDVSDQIKKDLQEARKYAEGRGIHIVVNDSKILEDIKMLVDFKLRY